KVGQYRALLYANDDRAMDWGQRNQREKEVGQGGLFGMISGGNHEPHTWDPAEPWAEGLKLKHEKETLGFYITGHPLRKYANEVRTYGNATTGVLAEKPSGSDVAIGGFVSTQRLLLRTLQKSFSRSLTKKGGRRRSSLS